MNARRAALRIFSGKNIFNFGIPERLRTLRYAIFTGGNTPSVKACGFATFPKGTAFGGNGKLSGIAQRRPLGGAGCERSEQTEGVSLSRSTHPKSSYAEGNCRKKVYSPFFCAADCAIL